jgi:hypothetical protein
MLNYPKMSATLLPRLAATAAGDFMFARADTVARTTLIGLVEPYAFDNTF